VIYPPVDLNAFKPAHTKGDYFLCVSRLVPYKRVDIVVSAFNQLGWPLTIIGSGSSDRELKKRAHNTIEFVRGDLTDAQLGAYYQKARAFVFAGEEDFGIVSLEAQACGKPVICYRESGMAETVIEGKTGRFFDEQSVPSLVAALRTFNKEGYDTALCRKNAEKFSVGRFQKEMKAVVARLSKNI
jgi:glycosyltransferase involved in cell wall biosynthesis